MAAPYGLRGHIAYLPPHGDAGQLTRSV